MRRAAFLAVIAGLTLAGAVRAADVTVFAAASLKTALDEIAADWQARTGHRVVLVYAGSNQLAQQIMQGAPADLFLSAAPDWMDVVEADGMVVAGTRADLLGNRLVLVAHDPAALPVTLDASVDLVAILGDGKLAMALVAAVPAGQYGKAALESLGLWDAIAPQVAQADNVRAALALVAAGEAPYGIVYASDAAAEPGVTVVGSFPEASHPPIRYPAAQLTGAADAADREFLDALAGPVATGVFIRNGFLIPDPEG